MNDTVKSISIWFIALALAPLGILWGTKNNLVRFYKHNYTLEGSGFAGNELGVTLPNGGYSGSDGSYERSGFRIGQTLDETRGGAHTANGVSNPHINIKFLRFPGADVPGFESYLAYDDAPDSEVFLRFLGGECSGDGKPVVLLQFHDSRLWRIQAGCLQGNSTVCKFNLSENTLHSKYPELRGMKPFNCEMEIRNPWYDCDTAELDMAHPEHASVNPNCPINFLTKD